MTCGIMGDLGGPTLNQPRLGFSYILPRLWDSMGVSTTSNVPKMFSNQPRAFTTSRYPYATNIHNL